MPSPAHNPSALNLLNTRRSPALAALAAPGPSRDTLTAILTAAMRVPDHARLEPWRFIVFEGASLASLGETLFRIGQQKNLDAEKLSALRARLSPSGVPTMVAAVFSPKQHPKVPEWEQAMSIGAACMNLCLAAHAHGFGAVWYSEWFATDPDALAHFALAAHEKIAGFIWLGTVKQMREDRPRPDTSAHIRWA